MDCNRAYFSPYCVCTVLGGGGEKTFSNDSGQDATR